MACTTAANVTKMVRAPQPCSRFCLPPTSSIEKAAIVIPSKTTANDIKKPTDLHMLQKYRFSA